MHVIIFDDLKHKSFYPITQTRSVGDIRCGILKLRQRLGQAFDAQQECVLIDPLLADIYQERHADWLINTVPEGDKLYLNSRLKLDDAAQAEITALQPNQALYSGEYCVAVRTSQALAFGFQDIPDAKKRQSQILLYQHLTDIVHDNSRLITRDFETVFYDADNFFEIETGVSVLNPYQVWLAEGVTLAPNVVLDASGGPIVIDCEARVMAGSVIQGPAYIGKKSVVKIGAKIYPGTSIGPVCKIGGEVEDSIFQAYSNKQHDGFLGHAFIGEWVNLGAGTNNSDLKNTYKNVNTYDYQSQSVIDSGSQFMGCVLGDHVKTGINTSLNTGLVVGTGSSIYGSKLFSGFVPDFSWGEAESLTKYRFSAFCDTVAIVKQRRGLSLSENEQVLLRQISGE
ncbi:MAG: putative sugar nucleotidyl transferase [Candidatus Cloacimonetes bacterium]|nr:putative sugar nucleotidyl transferase [Candidatus Cloacimonadota bacterium]